MWTNKQTNKQEESTISLFTAADTITYSLSPHHTHSVRVHTPPLPNMLVRSLFWAGWDQTGQRAFFRGETFLRESVRLCHPQEGSPRHADPTGDSGLLSASLSTVSHSVVLFCRPGCLWFCTTHISAVHQKTSGSADVLQTGVQGRGVQEAACGLFVPASLWDANKRWFVWLVWLFVLWIRRSKRGILLKVNTFKSAAIRAFVYL